MGENDYDWRPQALCAETGRVDMTSDDPAEIDRARQLCRSCPVRVDCAQHAMTERELWGVWGGTVDWERRRALGVDSMGDPKVNIFDLWCPFCQNPEVTITKKREYRGYPVHCGRCGVGWHTYRYPLKVRRALKRRSDDAVEKLRERQLADMGDRLG